jgi:YVTN family beta-propeller protein
VEIRLLGPVQVVRGDTELALGGAKQRALLALLVVHRPHALSVDRLVDLLWGEAAPRAAAKTVHVFISRLRKVLDAETIVTTESGYRLDLDPGSVDVDRFERMLTEGRALREGGRAREAATVLRQALGLWRGGAMSDLVYEPALQSQIAQLEELRVVALQERIDADLERGQGDELVPELGALLEEHPLRERLWAQLMLAQYRSGRQADALATYQRARATLDEELGLEPGPALRELEGAILAHEPRLRATTRLPVSGPRRPAWAVIILGALAAAIAAALLAVGALLVSGGSSPARPAVSPDSLAVIDTGRNTVAADLPIGAGPAAVTVAGGSVWVANAGDQTLARVDPTARQVVARIGLARVPTQLIGFGRSLWMASAIGERGVVERLDPQLGTVAEAHTVRVRFGSADDLLAPPTPSAIAAGPRGLFANDLQSHLWWLTDAGRTRTLDLGPAHSVDGIAIGNGAVWIASGADDRVLRLDPATGRVLAEIPVAAIEGARVASPDALAIGDGSVWVADALAGTVSRIDPGLNAVTATIRVGNRPTRLVVGAGAVWVLNAGDGTISRIDPRRGVVVATIPLGGDLTGLAAGAGAVWVTVAGGTPHSKRVVATAPVAALSSPSCSAPVPAIGTADLLVVSDLPWFNPGPRVDPAIADMRAAIRLVLEEHHFRAGRFRIAYQACDDSRPGEGADPGVCAANGRAYALDPSLAGVIGAYNSFCSGIELPALNTAPSGPVPLVSPSNTYVGLTRAGPATAADEPDRYYPAGTRNFARLVASDPAQSAGIDLFLHQRRRNRVYTLDDGAGTGYAGGVYARAAARALGVSVAGSATWSPTARNYRALASRIASAHPDAVLLSGCICSNGTRLVRDLRSALGSRTTLIGTDNFSDTFGFHDSSAFDGIYTSMAGIPASALPPAGRAFLRRLLPRRPYADIDPGVAYAAQATATLLGAIARSDGTRASIVRELLASRQTSTLVGSVSFDPRGDPSTSPIAIYRTDSMLPLHPHLEVQGREPATVVYPPARAIP